MALKWPFLNNHKITHGLKASPPTLIAPVAGNSTSPTFGKREQSLGFNSSPPSRILSCAAA